MDCDADWYLFLIFVLFFTYAATIVTANTAKSNVAPKKSGLAEGSHYLFLEVS